VRGRWRRYNEGPAVTSFESSGRACGGSPCALATVRGEGNAAGYRVLRFTRDDNPELAITRLRALLA
jgi:hypothetical protein